MNNRYETFFISPPTVDSWESNLAIECSGDGSQVNEALADCQAAVEKHDYYHRQVAVLKDAYRGTHELMDNGKASYLEVLTAQETLLNAQLNEAINMYNGAIGIIALYIALGGATK